MKYLFDLKNAIIDRFPALTADKVQLQIVNGNLPPTSQTLGYIARLYLLDCKLPNPYDVLGFIRKWFETRNMAIPELMFDCDVIDLESYDLQIDIQLSDKLNIGSDGATSVCPDVVWSDVLGTFISGAIVACDLTDSTP